MCVARCFVLLLLALPFSDGFLRATTRRMQMLPPSSYPGSRTPCKRSFSFSSCTSFPFVLNFSPLDGCNEREKGAVSRKERHHHRLSILAFTKKNLAVCTSMLAVLFATTLIIPQISWASDGKVLNEVWGIVNENFIDSSYNGNDWNKVLADNMKRIKMGADETELTKKMLSLLDDKYTRLLDKKYFESLWKYDALGVGLLLQSSENPGDTMIISAPPLSGSSGEKAGLKKGDKVYNINGKSTEGMTAMMVLDMLSNDDSDTMNLEYGRGEKGEGKKMVTLARVKTEPGDPPVSYSMKAANDGSKLGYIKLKDFNSEAIPGMKKAVTELERQGADAMVLDLRGNTGGGFQFALNIGGMFMDNKQMVTAAGRGNDKNPFPSSYQDGVLTKAPLVLWLDGLSASASEVLAGGLHDNCRAVTVGSNSFGKGKIQAVFGLADGEGLTMTVAQYVTPGGTVIQSKGLKPDIEIPTVNAYISMVGGGVFSEPDLSKLDITKAKQVLQQCQPFTSTTVTAGR